MTLPVFTKSRISREGSRDIFVARRGSCGVTLLWATVSAINTNKWGCIQFGESRTRVGARMPLRFKTSGASPICIPPPMYYVIWYTDAGRLVFHIKAVQNGCHFAGKSFMCFFLNENE